TTNNQEAIGKHFRVAMGERYLPFPVAIFKTRLVIAEIESQYKSVLSGASRAKKQRRDCYHQDHKRWEIESQSEESDQECVPPEGVEIGNSMHKFIDKWNHPSQDTAQPGEELFEDDGIGIDNSYLRLTPIMSGEDTSYLSDG
ncbi:hypothetical protein BGW42_007355, partial [Actinomortierella wolfii]